MSTIQHHLEINGLTRRPVRFWRTASAMHQALFNFSAQAVKAQAMALNRSPITII
jgi:hypothetical protein